MTSSLPQQERCHLCGAPASTTCPLCHRPTCADHMRSFPEELVPALGERACAACVERFVAQVEKERQQRERKREHDRWCRTCAICAREFEQVLPQCNVCGRPVCPEHRIRYRKQFRFGAHKGQEAAWYWDYDVRCRDHKRSPWLVRLQGWEIDPTDGQDTP